MLFERDKSVISRHLRNIFKTGELVRRATVAKIATVQMEGNREIVRQVEYFNLDAIFSEKDIITKLIVNLINTKN